MKKKMNKTISFIIVTLMIFMMISLPGCSQKEPSVVKICDAGEYSEDNELTTLVKHYEMSDGTWKTDNYTYKYKLEITGRMNSAAKDSTFVFLSNTKDITFEQAWKASGLSSLGSDYFEEADAILVAWK